MNIKTVIFVCSALCVPIYASEHGELISTLRLASHVTHMMFLDDFAWIGSVNKKENHYYVAIWDCKSKRLHQPLVGDKVKRNCFGKKSKDNNITEFEQLQYQRDEYGDVREYLCNSWTTRNQDDSRSFYARNICSNNRDYKNYKLVCKGCNVVSIYKSPAPSHE